MGDYPKRPAFFALKFIRRLGKSAVGSDLTPDVRWLLSLIVATEDAAGMRRAVAFYNDDLAVRTGMSLAGMKRARDRAVGAGWLHYEPGAKGRAARYYVTVPAWADGLDDGAGDEIPGELSGPVPAQIVAQPEPESEPLSGPDSRILAQAEPECEPQPGQNVSHLLTYSYSKKEEGTHPPNTSTPTPEKKPTARTPKGDPAIVPIPVEIDTPEFRTTWCDWLADRKARRKPMAERAARLQLADLLPRGRSPRSLASRRASPAGGQASSPTASASSRRRPNHLAPRSASTPPPSIPDAMLR